MSYILLSPLSGGLEWSDGVQSSQALLTGHKLSLSAGREHWLCMDLTAGRGLCLLWGTTGQGAGGMRVLAYVVIVAGIG